MIDQNGAIYERVRGWIDDPNYWLAEETHFFVVLNIIQDHHSRQAQVSREPPECPPLDTLQHLWDSAKAEVQHMEICSLHDPKPATNVDAASKRWKATPRKRLHRPRSTTMSNSVSRITKRHTSGQKLFRSQCQATFTAVATRTRSRHYLVHRSIQELMI